MDVEKIESALDEKECRTAFDQLLVRCTYWLGFSFVFSAVLNFILARWIVVSPSGTEAYNAEVARMMLELAHYRHSLLGDYDVYLVASIKRDTRFNGL